jgi:hypothetical protein
MEEPLECSELAPSASLNPAVHPVGGWRGYRSRALAPLSLRHLHPSCTFGAPTPLHPPGPTRPLGRWHAPSGGPFLPSSGPPGTAAPVRRLRAIGTNRGGRILRRRGRSWRAIARLSDSVGGERPVSGGPRGASADSGSLRGDHWVGSDPLAPSRTTSRVRHPAVAADPVPTHDKDKRRPARVTPVIRRVSRCVADRPGVSSVRTANPP